MVVVYHYDVSTLEWEDCAAAMISELPEDPPAFWSRKKQNLVINADLPSAPTQDYVKAASSLPP